MRASDFRYSFPILMFHKVVHRHV